MPRRWWWSVFDRRYADGWIMRLPQEDMCQALGIAAGSKYECDNGPGILPIMDLLVHSEESHADRANFLRSQLLFWLLAGIDGHAKNFSIFIGPSGRFRMTPLYDIMSAHPLLDAKQLQSQKIKMAMAVSGKTGTTIGVLSSRVISSQRLKRPDFQRMKQRG